MKRLQKKQQAPSININSVNQQIMLSMGQGGEENIREYCNCLRRLILLYFFTFLVMTNHFLFTDIDLKVAAKFFGTKFACGSSVTGDDEIVIQGDVKDDLFDIIPEKWPEVCSCISLLRLCLVTQQFKYLMWVQFGWSIFLSVQFAV